MTKIKTHFLSLLFIVVLGCNETVNNKKDTNFIYGNNNNLIIGAWVLDSIKTPSRTIKIGSYYCLIGKPKQRHYLEFKDDSCLNYIKTNIGKTFKYKFKIINDSILVYKASEATETKKIIKHISETNLVLSDTAKIDGCVIWRPIGKSDNLKWFEKTNYFYSRIKK